MGFMLFGERFLSKAIYKRNSAISLSDKRSKIILTLRLIKFPSSANSTRRPVHFPAAEDVAMQMRHGFTGIGAIVEHEPVAGLLQSKFVRDLGGFEHQVAQDFVIFRH